MPDIEGEATRAALSEVVRYYEGTVARHGATPLGVDWSCEPTQHLRFVQLLRICDFTRSSFSLKDVGCGYGALRSFIDERYPKARVDYIGVDLAPAMIRRAKRIFKGRRDVTLRTEDLGDVVDYSMASGVFNVQLDAPRAAWERMVEGTLRSMHEASRVGCAVNFMAARESPGRKELYRCEPRRWVEFCESVLGASVEVLANYGMREFTLLIRRAEPEKTFRQQ